MPRQRQSPTGELRDQAVRVHLSASEKAYLQQRAGGLSLSTYLRQAGLGQAIPERRHAPPPPQLNRELLMTFGTISTHLNLLATACRQSAANGQPCTIDASVLDELRVELRAIGWAIAGIAPEAEEEDEP